MLNFAATWFLSYAMHSVLICAVALILVRVTRFDAASRCVIWRAVLFFPLLTASLAVSIASKRAGDRSQLSVIEPMRRIAPSQYRKRNVEMFVTTINGRPQRRVTEVNDPLSSVTTLVILVLATSMSAVGLAAHLRGTSRIRKVLRERTPATHVDPVVARRGITISESAIIEVPIALRGREICVPRMTFQTMGEPERTSVLLHEIAHVERSDPMWMDASRALCSITWWQPLTRMVRDRLELDTESAADCHAVALGARPHALVAGLAFFAGLIDARFAGAGAALLHQDSPLVSRARLILDRDRQEGSPHTRRFLAIGLVAAAALLTALPVLTTAGAGPMPGPHPVAGAGQRIVEEEKDVTILRNDRQP